MPKLSVMRRTVRMRLVFSLSGLAARLLSRTAFAPFPAVPLAERISMLPEAADGLGEAISIRWNDKHIPFVEASSDHDAAVGLGLVHGHLRLAQLELMRRAALGRLAEVAGPAAADLDQLLRLVDFPRATNQSLAMMPAETRSWVDGFADGINAAADRSPLPAEFSILGITPEPWSAADLFAVSRLCSADYAWRVWRTLNRLRQSPDWHATWADLMDPSPALAAVSAQEDLTTTFTKAGSNAFALSGARTETGAPLLACDPHHVVMTPTLWLIAGYKSPSAHVWGLMIPGLPVFAPGRNAHGAWGGTNLHATSSELVDVAEEPITSHPERIMVRGAPAKTIEKRESAFGPVISDAAAFAMPSETVSLTWMGHRPGDDFTAFNGMARAKSWDAFLAAADSYSLPGLNMIWAGEDGTIGKAIAAKIPQRPLTPPADIVTTPDAARAHWSGFLTAKTLPHETNPASGIVISANEAPPDQAVTISLFFAADHRFERLMERLRARTRWTIDTIKTLFFDVYHAPSHAMATDFAAQSERLGLSGPVHDAIAAWDGSYAQDSRGALAFALVAHGLVERLEPTAPRPTVSQFWRPFDRLRVLVENAPPDALDEALKNAFVAAAAPLSEHKVWGAFHTMALSHPLARLPWLRRRLPTVRFAIGGSNETVQKAMHAYTDRPAASTFGQNARFLADLSDRDATYASILGGQDGWAGSATMFDQVEDWRAGTLVRLPFSTDVLVADFPHTTTVTPGDA